MNAPERAAESSRPVGSQNPAETTPLHLRSARHAKKFLQLAITMIASSWMVVTVPPVAAQDTSPDLTGGSTDTLVTTTDDPTTDTTVNAPAIDPTITDPSAPIIDPATGLPMAPAAAATIGPSNSDYDGPVGVSGIFNGNITTGCSYDPMTHSAKRTIDDIVVPGSIGKYPLKMTRYYNSRLLYANAQLGGGWEHEYSWFLTSAGSKLVAPSGATYDYRCGDSPIGVSEYWETARPTSPNFAGTFRLADGGKVMFSNGAVTDIYDPYGLRTRILRDGFDTISQVIEPGGRYLLFIYTSPHGTRMLTRVEAHGFGNGTVTDSVDYSYTVVDPGGSGTPSDELTGVAYSDGTTASYAYQADNVAENPPRTFKIYPLLSVATDVRYKGPMRQISYLYDVAAYPVSAPHGAILRERNYAAGLDVSKIQPQLVASLLDGSDPPTLFTETRGDGQTRTFTYSRLRTTLNNENTICPDYIDTPHQQLLLSYTDFQGHSTSLDYTNGFVTSVTDANTHKTIYTRGASIGEVQRITHPDTRYIQYTYTVGDPHYVVSIDDENRNLTVHSRDGDHQILHTEYKDSTGAILASEHFTYNGFGQVLRHQLKNGKYVHYQYDTRGLLTAKTNPTSIDVPGGAFTWAPKTTYTYYTSGPWTDRVLTETLPANSSGYQASQTYEYDRSASNAAVAGRGQVTKITHADNTYQAFDYDAYGNKIWERNEMNEQTRYTYDVYNRMLTSTRVMVITDANDDETTTYTYNSTNGSNTSPLLHTTSNPDSVTTAAGIVTKHDYDPNFRKTSTTVAPSSLNLTTTFAYDNVGNQTDITDPLNHTTHTTFDTRDRKRQVTRAYGTASAETTTYSYDAANNVTRIDPPDVRCWEMNEYDGLNRVTKHTVPRLSSTDTIDTQFVYFPSGMVQKVTDGNGHWTQFLYDESNRRTQMDQQGGSQRTWTWDGAGNLASRITVGGKTQTFTYDNRNRKKTMTWSNTAEWQFFAYDAASRLTTAQNGTGAWNTNIISTVTRDHDAAGRLTLDRQAVTGLASKDVKYQYDKDGKMNRMYVVGASYDYTFSYDAAGRFWKIFATGSATPAYMYTYDDASNETQRYNFANAVGQNYGRDLLNRMSSRSLTRAGNTLANEVYTYDPMDRITAVNRESANDDTFTYYLDGELNTATYAGAGAGTDTYNVDKGGNRTSVIDNGVTKSYVPNVVNQYTTADSKVETNGLEHEISAYDGVSYTYVNDGQLSRSAFGSGSVAYSYDALGRIVKRVLNGTQTYLNIYDGEKCIYEYNVNGAITARNVYGKGIDEILERTDTVRALTFYYQQDHEGSVSQLTSAAGAIIEKYRYDAFGAPTIYNAQNAWIWPSAYGNNVMFTGRLYQNYGYYEYRARAYQPYIGRFMSEDPKLFDAGDYNLFRYCHNDPVDLTDAMGLAPVGVDAETDNWIQQASDNNYSAQRNSRWSRLLLNLPLLEYGTTVLRDNQTSQKSLSPTYSKGSDRGVRPLDYPGKTSLVYTHIHPNENWSNVTRSYLSDDDVAVGIATGRVITVRTPAGIQDRYRPSERATWQERKDDGGSFDHLNKDGKWVQLPTATDVRVSADKVEDKLRLLDLKATRPRFIQIPGLFNGRPL
jgi:RHS repeat-associated protein